MSDLQDSMHRNFRKGMLSREDAIGYFPDNEPIWVMANSLQTKEDVEDALNRKTVHIRSVDDLIQAIEDAPKHNSRPLASCLIFKDLPEGIKVSMGQVRSVFQVAETIKLYEIGRGDDIWIERSYQYGTLTNLVAQAKGLRRSQFIYEMDPDDKQREILESLEDDVAIEKGKNKSKDDEIAQLKKTQEDLINQNRDLQTKIKYELEPNLKDKDSVILELRNKLDNLGTDLESERRKSYDFSITNNELMVEKTNNKYTIEALETKLAREEALNQALRSEIENKDEEIKESHGRMRELIATAVDGEKFAILEKDLRKKEQRILELESQVQQVSVLNRTTEIDNDKLKEQIKLMRNSQKALEVVGRTTQLDHYTLKQTDLVYIKVIDELPYYKLALKFLFEELQKRYGDQFVNLCIIRQDEGMDNALFRDMPVIHDFTELDSTTTQYRLHPHATMFTGLDSYESNFDCLLVVDYIKNNDYLLDSLSRKTLMTMVRYPDMVKDPRLGLEGLPLSIGTASIYNLAHRPDIERTNMRQTRHNMVKRAVEEWADKLNIRERNYW